MQTQLSSFVNFSSSNFLSKDFEEGWASRPTFARVLFPVRPYPQPDKGVERAPNKRGARPFEKTAREAGKALRELDPRRKSSERLQAGSLRSKNEYKGQGLAGFWLPFKGGQQEARRKP